MTLRRTSRRGPIITTILTNPNTRPGHDLQGQVCADGGDEPVTIEHVTLSLTVTTSDATAADLQVLELPGPLHLGAGDRRWIPFQLAVPWDVPITEVGGQRLYPMSLNLRTEWSSCYSPRLSRIAVHPLAEQEHIFAALEHFGFQLVSSSVDSDSPEQDGVGGRHLVQEFTFRMRRATAGRTAKVIFQSDQAGTDIMLSVDGGTATCHFRLNRHETGRWLPAHVESWLRQAIGHAGRADRIRE
ncbi:MAG TPA: sporulation protein [Micromonospora sp.]